MSSVRVCFVCKAILWPSEAYELRLELRNVKSRAHGDGRTLGIVCRPCSKVKLAQNPDLTESML